MANAANRINDSERCLAWLWWGRPASLVSAHILHSITPQKKTLDSSRYNHYFLNFTWTPMPFLKHLLQHTESLLYSHSDVSLPCLVLLYMWDLVAFRAANMVCLSLDHLNISRQSFPQSTLSSECTFHNAADDGDNDEDVVNFEKNKYNLLQVA